MFCRLDFSVESDYLVSSIKSWADALANLPSRARWIPKGDAATSATKRVAHRQSSLSNQRRFFYVRYICRGFFTLVPDESKRCGAAGLARFAVCSNDAREAVMTSFELPQMQGLQGIRPGLLYPHQADGVAFLLSKKRAILGDDMGLGKTRQAIVALDVAVPEGAILVVCPASLKLKREPLRALIEAFETAVGARS